MAESLSQFQSTPGRGTLSNPKNRFERLEIEIDPDAVDDLFTADPEFEIPRPRTEYFRDESRTIISRNESPDLRFNASLNPYRGCEHGCAYCYARPYHEYLGFSAGLDFETRIMIKPEAPDLLRRELASPKWEPQPLACSGVTDCYQPVEKELGITRGCLEVLVEFRNPVTIVTKNHLVTRDIGPLAELAHHRAAAVMVSITSLDPELSRRMEPRASSPRFRLETLRELSEAGIPAGVSLAPVIPGLNDHEIPAILEAARDHGASFAAFSVVRLPHGVPELFFDWMESHYPEQRQKVDTRIRSMRGGKTNETRFGMRMRGDGPVADAIERLFSITKRRFGYPERGLKLSTDFFRLPGEEQLRLF